MLSPFHINGLFNATLNKRQLTIAEKGFVMSSGGSLTNRVIGVHDRLISSTGWGNNEFNWIECGR